MREEDGQTLVVAATDEPAAETHAWYQDEVRSTLHQHGKLAFPWRLRLLDDKVLALSLWPYLYFYAGMPDQALIYRLHLDAHRTTKVPGGMECPWPTFDKGDWRDRTPAGQDYTGRFKTWFLVDRVEALEPSISVADLVRLNGAPASPYGLRSGYGLWRLR